MLYRCCKKRFSDLQVQVDVLQVQVDTMEKTLRAIADHLGVQVLH